MTNQAIDQVFEFDAIPYAKRYHSPDTMWGCYDVYCLEEIPESTLANNLDWQTGDTRTTYQFKLIGKMQELIIGGEYHIKAKLVYSPKYKYSYEVISIVSDVPKTHDEQMRFLKSIVTEKQAGTLLSVYPNIVEDVMNGTDSVDLSLTKGIKDYTWSNIKEKIIGNYAIADILSLLTPLGISYNKIKKLLNNEPNPQVLKQKLMDDPYVLTDAISFKQTDKLALKLDPEFMVSSQRATAFLKYYFRHVGEYEGHTWITIDALDTAVKENIIECFDIYRKILEDQRTVSTFLYIEGDKVGWKYYHYVEEKIWEIVSRANEETPLEIPDEDIETGIEKAEEMQGFKFLPEQIEIIKNCTKNNFCIITGKAGTGKTTIARGLLSIYGKGLFGIGACALSAKAAKRITEATGFPAVTIHRLLGASGNDEFTFDEDNPLPYNVLFVDEASMINSGLFMQFLRAVAPNSKIILCGDSKQLPPIGYGNTFADLLEKENLQVNYLTKIMRQAEDSGITFDANQIREGINPLKKIEMKTVHGINEDMWYMFRDSRDALNQIAIKTYMATVEDVGIDNVYILVPRKDNCLNSSREINRVIQDLLLAKTLPKMTYGETEFRRGAKVIHTKNNYEKGVFNGDQGTITSIITDADGRGVMTVEYPDRGVITYNKEELDELDLAYALTVHKFQGSEAKVIICIIDNTHNVLLDTCFLYTAITRAKDRCLLLAEPRAFNVCLFANKGRDRQTWTKLFW